MYKIFRTTWATWTTFADIYFSDFSSFTFIVPVGKVVTGEEELHSIKIDGFLNLENIYLEQCLSIKNNGR